MNLQENINRIKQVMGIITENEMDRILDKISVSGMDSLTHKEKSYLKNPKEEEEAINEDDYRYYIMIEPKYHKLYTKMIKNILNDNSISSIVTYEHSFPYFYFQVLVEHEFQVDKVTNILTEKGFTIIGSGEVTKERTDKVKNMINTTRNEGDMVLMPNHEHNLTRDQEIERINKYVHSMGIDSFSLLAGTDGTFIIRFSRFNPMKSLTDKTGSSNQFTQKLDNSLSKMDELISVLEKNGYDVSKF
jgi:hypothetical protein